MTGHAAEVIVSCEHGQVVSDAELCQQRVDRSDLYAGAPALISELGRLDMVFPIRSDQGQDLKDLPALLRT
jgi:hypothetical protein